MNTGSTNPSASDDNPYRGPTVDEPAIARVPPPREPFRIGDSPADDDYLLARTLLQDGCNFPQVRQKLKEHGLDEIQGEALTRLVHSPENSYRKTLLCECVSAYLPTDEEQRQQFEDMVRNHPDPGVQAMEMGLLDHVEQRGEERGLVKGRREMVRELLEDRFGALSPTVIARLEAWPADRLRELGRGLLSASTLEELGLGDNEFGTS